MSITIPYSLTLALTAAGIMQRLGAGRLSRHDYDKEASFSLYSSYVCFAAAIVALAAGSFFR